MLTSSIENIRLTLNQILKRIIHFPVEEIINCITPVSYNNCQNVIFNLNEKMSVMLIFANNRKGIFPVSFKTENSTLKLYNESMDIVDSDIICDEDVNSDLIAFEKSDRE